MKSTVYLQLEPTWSRWSFDQVGDERVPKLDSVRVARTTAKRPGRPIAGTVIVKLVIDVPASVFRQVQPTVHLTIPEALTEGIIEVEAVDPHEPEPTDD